MRNIGHPIFSGFSAFEHVLRGTRALFVFVVSYRPNSPARFWRGLEALRPIRVPRRSRKTPEVHIPRMRRVGELGEEVYRSLTDRAASSAVRPSTPHRRE